MKYQDLTEYSPYLTYLGDNISQLAESELLFNTLGGRWVMSHEIQEHLSAKVDTVIFSSVFVIFPSILNQIRVFVGHGVSDKPIAQFDAAHSNATEDYYITSGLKFAWLLTHYHHALTVPYNKEIRVGHVVSDFYFPHSGLYRLRPMLPPGEEEAWVTREERKLYWRSLYGIETDREVIVFSPTFQTGSMEFYYPLMKKLAEKYFIILRCHDRESHFEPTKDSNILELRGLDHPSQAIACADYYMGDGSSVDNIGVFADIPMIMFNPPTECKGPVPYEYDIRATCPHYTVTPMEGQMPIEEMMEDAKAVKWEKKRHDYIERSFFFNDGRCGERFIEVAKRLVDLLKERKNLNKFDRRYTAIRKAWDACLPPRDPAMGEDGEMREEIDYKVRFKNLI